MLRSLFSAMKSVNILSSSQHFLQQPPAVRIFPSKFQDQKRNICEIKCLFPFNNGVGLFDQSLTSGHRLLQPIPVQSCSAVRTVHKFTKGKGKRQSVKLVLKKFYRLNWGIWIRCRAGRHNKLYKKSAHCRRRLQYHVFCNSTQSRLLDKMVTKYWRTPKHYVDDPYEPFHSREEFAYTRLKPWEPPL